MGERRPNELAALKIGVIALLFVLSYPRAKKTSLATAPACERSLFPGGERPMWTRRADCQSAHTLFAPARVNRGRGQELPDVVLSPIIRTGLGFHFISSALLLLKSLAALKSCGGEAKIAFWPLLSPQPPSAASPSSLSHCHGRGKRDATGKAAPWENQKIALGRLS